MPVKRFEHKHTLCQNNREHHDSHVTSIAGIEQLASCPGVFVMILYEIANNQIRVDKSLLPHRVSSRRAVSAAASWILAKTSPSPCCYRVGTSFGLTLSLWQTAERKLYLR